MKSIKKGNVHFLTVPLTFGEKDKVSPVVIVREPYAWDDYRSVTVIPAYNTAEPRYSLPYGLINRDGYGTVHEYRFIPHLVTTVPVSHIGRFIGTMDRCEFEVLMDEFRELINMDDPFSDYEVPFQMSMYKRLADEAHPKIYSERKAKPEPVATAKPAFKPTFSMLDPVPGSKKTKPKPVIHENVDDENVIDNEPEPPLKVEMIAPYETWMLPGVSYVDPQKAGFPETKISESDLKIYAKTFKVPSDFYDGTRKKLNYRELPPGEFKDALSELTSLQKDAVLDLYDSCTAMDTRFFSIWMPVHVLCKVYKLRSQEAYAFKRLCNVLEKYALEKIGEDHTAVDERIAVDAVREIREEKKADSFEEKYRPITDRQQIMKMIDRMRPYLNDRKLMMLPENLYEDFIRVPFYVLKGQYNGSLGQLKSKYNALHAKVESTLRQKIAESEQ